MGLEQVKLVDLPKYSDARGSLTFIEELHIPFSVKRVYYLYDTPPGQKRGAHAHKQLQQLIIAIAGSFDIILNDGRQSKTFRLDCPHTGLYVPKLIWRDLENFSVDALCLVLASEPYDESDYYRDYDVFIGDVIGKEKEPAYAYSIS